MPAPTPLTQCPSPNLDWSRPDTPAAADFGDIYFSTDGGLEETRTVFLKGCGLPERWADKPVFTIGELGFGTGLNFLAAWQMWEAHKPNNGRLHFISIEKFPLSAAQLSKALKAWPELSPFAKKLIGQWPDRVKGFHRLHFGDVTLTLVHDDVRPALTSLKAQIDAWFLDGFSPSKNPDMWSEDTLSLLTPLTAKDAQLATFTVAGFVREGLKKAGFTPMKKPGFGRKRERLEAVFTGRPAAQSPNMKAPTIIGAGIAGSSLAQAFLRRGITPNIISRGMTRAASANPAALVKPRFDLQDRPESRFFLASYLYAVQAYRKSGAILSEGINHLPKTEDERQRFEKLATQAPLPKSHLDWQGNQLCLPQSLVIDPNILRREWLEGVDIEERDIKELADMKASGPVIIAAGFGAKGLLKDYDLPLRFSRGQLSWAVTDLTRPVSYGGYAVPLGEATLLGATHDRLTGDDPYLCRAEDDAKNLDGFLSATGQRAELLDRPSRASIRVTTASTLPLLARLEDNIWAVSGLGSRGFVFAPLLAEALISDMLGEALPIEAKLWARFHRA